jgi:hypothetical protein
MVNGVTQEMVDNGAQLGVFRTGKDDCMSSVILEKTGSVTVEINAPMSGGNCEIRLYKNNTNDASALMYTTAIIVGGADEQSGG